MEKEQHIARILSPTGNHRLKRLYQHEVQDVVDGTVGNKTLWDKVREVPPFLAAVVALISAVVAASAAIHAYFATKAELNALKCFSENNIEILSRQIEQTTALSAYTEFVRRIQQLENDVADGEAIDRVEFERLKDEKKAAWDLVQDRRKSTNETIEFLKNGGCDDP